MIEYEGQPLDEKYLFLYFSASWCGPCKVFKPIAEEVLDGYTTYFVDADTHMDLAGQYKIRSVPTLLLLQGGEVIATHTGASTKAKLASWVASYTGVES